MARRRTKSARCQDIGRRIIHAADQNTCFDGYADMSQKITAKNLSYDDDNTPPFLARLRAQAAGQAASGPDPLSQRRAAKKRSASEEAEDGPLVVDEDNNVLSVEIDKDGEVKRSEKETEEKTETEERTEGEAKPEEVPKIGIGARRKRAGKVVGADEGGKKAPEEVSSKATTSREPTKDNKVKKKAKIKLSFDEEG